MAEAATRRQGGWRQQLPPPPRGVNQSSLPKTEPVDREKVCDSIHIRILSANHLQTFLGFFKF